MNTRSASILVLSLISFLFISCEKPSYFQASQALEEAVWHEKEALSFKFQAPDTALFLDFYLDIRNNDDYPYRNLYTFITMDFPNGKSLKDTLHFPHMAMPDGEWTGSGLGGSYDNSILYKRKRKLPLPGEYKIRIEQAMRDEQLKGVERVGIHIESHVR